MSFPSLVAGLLVVSVLLAWWRLGMWWRASPVAARSRPWRLALLTLGQPVAATMLFLTLFPPTIATPGRRTLTVATRNAPRQAMLAIGGDVVTLPEAAASGGASRAPDLATALRRHPGIERLHLLGDGLEPRDVEAARGLTIAFDPPPLPRGLIALAPPERVAPGGDFHVGGETSGVRGTVELLDPGGARVAIVPIDADGRFDLTGAARVPGPALFRVRLRDARGGLVEEAEVPVVATVDPPVRVLFLAGAPSPEVKYWRRWAVDAALSATVRQAVGDGLDLGDPVPSLGAAMLARYDLVVVDERSWAALSSGERLALEQAVRGGLGLLLRATGPLPPGVQAGWRALGVPLADGIATAPVRSRDPDEPDLTRRVLPLGGPQLVQILRGVDGSVLASWRAVGRGRIGIWSVTDDFALVTSGHGERFGAWWGDTIGTLARARQLAPPWTGALARAGIRTSICGAGAGATVVAPNGRTASLLPDAAAGGCAGYWPRNSGWHAVRRADSRFPFYVYPTEALPGVRAAERRDTTLQIDRSAAKDAGQVQRRRTANWPWLIGFILLTAGLWLLERAGAGRGRRFAKGSRTGA